MDLRRTAAAVVVALAVGGTGLVVVASPADAAVKRFANCTALHKVYRHGVGRPGARDKVRGSTRPVTTFTRNLAVYKANSRLDADHDGIACEKR